MEIAKATESTRWGRYTLVRVVSRGGDYVISNAIIWFYDEQSFYWAIAVAALFNFFSDYAGNRFWAFSADRPSEPRNTASLMGYAFMRLNWGLLGFCVLFLFYKLLLLPYPASSLLAGIVMWLFSFKAFKRYFTGYSNKRF